MANVSLVSPPFGLEEAAGKSKSMKAVMNIIPPLGIAYIAAVLENAGHNVKIFDCTSGIPHDELIERLKAEKPDVVGLTSTTAAFESALTVVKNVKRELPGALTIIGGSHITAMPEQTLLHEEFDIGVLGEGEYTFREVVAEFEKNRLKSRKKIKGIAYREGKRIIINERRQFIQNLDEIPFPARHLLPPLSAYHPTPASYKRLPQGVIMTTRGCPSLCTFCDRSIFGCSYRERSAENVLDELEELVHKYGAKDVKFFDDTFTINKRRLYEICDGIIERKLDITWSCLTKANVVDEEMLKRMKKAGCWQVLYGIESGDARMLALLKKGTTVEHNEKAIRLAHKAGLSVRADYILGTPGETLESMERTLKFAIRMNTDFAHFNKFVPYPGTEIYERLLERGYKFSFDQQFSQLDHSVLYYLPDGMDKEKYLQFFDTAYKRYYLRPAYLLKQLIEIRSVQDVKRKAAGFGAIINL